MLRTLLRLWALSLLFIASLSVGATQVDLSRLSVRISVANTERVPNNNLEGDTTFHEVFINSNFPGASPTLWNTFLGYTSTQQGWVTQSQPIPPTPQQPALAYSMYGPLFPQPALAAGCNVNNDPNCTGYDGCGRWINSVEIDPTTSKVLTWYHAEQPSGGAGELPCDKVGRSMAFAVSTNGGVTFSDFIPPGFSTSQVITGSDVLTPGCTTGEADGSVVKFGQFYYMYLNRSSFLDPADCKNTGTAGTSVARTPVTPVPPATYPGQPGTWKKWDGSGWNSNGIGGHDIDFGQIGFSASLWQNYNYIMMLRADFVTDGILAWFSPDGISFTRFQEPLLPFKYGQDRMKKDTNGEFIFYPSVVSFTDGSNRWTDHFLLFYTYVQPGEPFSQRYLAAREVTMTIDPDQDPNGPHVGVELSRWYNSSQTDSWVTTAMVPGANISWQYQTRLGYVMTAPPSNGTTVAALYDCFITNWSDHMVSIYSDCEQNLNSNLKIETLRQIGWMYISPQPNSQPIYRCWDSANLNHFVSNSSTCEGVVPAGDLLGWILADGCNAVISPISQSFSATIGNGSVSVTVRSGCSWNAASADQFITITSGASGNGNGVVSYTVAPNLNSTNRTGTISIAGQTFTLLQGAQFNDVPVDHPFYDSIGKLSARGVTAGCGNGNYCPDASVTREQMAIYIEHALGVFTPPTPTQQTFADVPTSRFSYPYIEDFYARGISAGCATNPLVYCPDALVTREQMAIFVERGLGVFTPPTPTQQTFADVPASWFSYPYIEDFYNRGITAGCGTNPLIYCPAAAVSRGQMAVFLVRAFGL